MVSELQNAPFQLSVAVADSWSGPPGLCDQPGRIRDHVARSSPPFFRTRGDRHSSPRGSSSAIEVCGWGSFVLNAELVVGLTADTKHLCGEKGVDYFVNCCTV